MNITIYNSADDAVTIQTKADIVAVCVTIFSGDETAILIDCNGDTEKYDAGGIERFCYEGTYMIADNPEKIKAWAQWRPKVKARLDSISVLRQDYFCNDGIYDREHKKVKQSSSDDGNKTDGETNTQPNGSVIMGYPKVIEGVYALYLKGRIVYIGESHNIYNRIGEHIQENVKEFDSFDVYATSNRKELEKRLIEALYPIYNVRHSDRYEVFTVSNDVPLIDAIKICESRDVTVSGWQKSQNGILCEVKREAFNNVTDATRNEVMINILADHYTVNQMRQRIQLECYDMIAAMDKNNRWTIIGKLADMYIAVAEMVKMLNVSSAVEQMVDVKLRDAAKEWIVNADATSVDNSTESVHN